MHFFVKLLFWHLDNLQKEIAPLHTICVFKMLKKNTIKLGQNKQKNTLDRFSTHRRANLGQIFDSTTYIHIYIYTYATGFICGPSKRLSSVHLRPPLFETTVFIARNGFLRFPEIKFPHCFRIFRVFEKCHFGGRRGLFLRSGKFFVLCACFWSGLFQAQSKR